MDISYRIKKIVEEIKYDVIADIGTDHGYIPIYAVLSGKANKAIACDINKKPLEMANINIKNNSLEGKIETRLGNGLTCLKKNEVDVVVIAGMGGMLVRDILRNDIDIVSNLKQMVISPHLNVMEIRQEIHRIGFKIENEVIVKELGKFYNIISCIPGEEDKYTDEEYIFGKILLKNKTHDFYKYLESKIIELEKIKEKINIRSNENDNNIFLRLQEINELHSIYKAVVDEWE